MLNKIFHLLNKMMMNTKNPQDILKTKGNLTHFTNSSIAFDHAESPWGHKRNKV